MKTGGALAFLMSGRRGRGLRKAPEGFRAGRPKRRAREALVLRRQLRDVPESTRRAAHQPGGTRKFRGVLVEHVCELDSLPLFLDFDSFWEDRLGGVLKLGTLEMVVFPLFFLSTTHGKRHTRLDRRK